MSSCDTTEAGTDPITKELAIAYFDGKDDGLLALILRI